MTRLILLFTFLLLSASSGVAMAFWHGSSGGPAACGTIDLSNGCVQPMLGGL